MMDSTLLFWILGTGIIVSFLAMIYAEIKMLSARHENRGFGILFLLSIVLIAIFTAALGNSNATTQIGTYPTSLLNISSYNQVCNNNNVSYAHALFPQDGRIASVSCSGSYIYLYGNTTVHSTRQIASYPVSLLNISSYNAVCNSGNLSYASRLFPQDGRISSVSCSGGMVYLYNRT